jgi:hypothetical protein
MSYQLSNLFAQPQVIITTITEADSHIARSDLLAVKAEITTERFPRALSFAAADVILGTRQPVSVGPRGRWTVGGSGGGGWHR